MMLPSPRRRALSAALLLTLSAPGVAGEDWPAGAICSRRDAAAVSRPQIAPASLRCAAWPAGYHQIRSAGGGDGDVAIALAVGAAPDGRQLCYIADGVPEAPVIRVRAGHRLTVRLESTLNDGGAAHDRNCPLQTYVEGGACAQPEQGFMPVPGADGPFYPIETNVPHLADGTTNLHVHGLSVSALPCHDEVLRSAVYPANWTGPTATLGGCQSEPNALTYSYDIPADHPTGLYWYHSHRHGQAQAATMLGLSGAIVIEGPADDARRRQGIADDVLIVRDVPVGDDSRPAEAQRHRLNRARRLGARPAAAPATVDPRIDRANEVACGADDPDTGGPQITRLTLNGAAVPDMPDPAAPPPDALVPAKAMRPGERQLWRLLNASANTYIAPRLVREAGGWRTVLPLVLVARDGVPVADDAGNQRLETVDTVAHPLLMAPGNRLEFLVTAPPPGASLYLESAGVAPGCAGDGDPPRRLLRAVATGEVTGPSLVAADSARPAGRNLRYTHLLDTAPAVSRTFAFTEFPRGFAVQHSRWPDGAPGPGQYDPDATDFLLTETASTAGDLGPVALKPFDMHSLMPDVVVHLGHAARRVEQWTIRNYTLEVHAFHLHQLHFRQVLARGEGPLLDVISVPPASRTRDGLPAVPGEVTIRIGFDAASIGEFVYHCHILEHEDNGMMGKVRVAAD